MFKETCGAIVRSRECFMKINETSECQGEALEPQPCNLDTSCDSGVIDLQKYESNLDLIWLIKPDCEYFHLWSEMFKTWNEHDFLDIGGDRFFDNDHIDLMLKNGTYLHFISDGATNDDGFVLNWMCADFSPLWDCESTGYFGKCVNYWSHWNEWSGAHNLPCSTTYRYRKCIVGRNGTCEGRATINTNIF